MLPPLVDLGPGQTYKGQEGGLYPGGKNTRPAAHDAAGQKKIARAIVPLALRKSRSRARQNRNNASERLEWVRAWHRGDESDTSTTFMTGRAPIPPGTQSSLSPTASNINWTEATGAQAILVRTAFFPHRSTRRSKTRESPHGRYRSFGSPCPCREDRGEPTCLQGQDLSGRCSTI